MKQNQTRNVLNVTSVAKPDKKPIKSLLVFMDGHYPAGYFLGRCGQIVSLSAWELSRHMSNLNRSESEKFCGAL